MNEQKEYIPFSELPDVSTGSTPSLYYIKGADGTKISLQFLDGRLDEASLQVKQNASDELRQTIELLEKKLMDEEVMGVEDEADDDESKQPFDPSTISIEKRVITMDAIIRRMEQNTIRLNPGFQRKEVWDETRKCQLIESLLLCIPIPMFYVAADAKGGWTVVDGLQRLSTIRDFVLGQDYLKTMDVAKKGHGFRLTGLEFCGTLLNGHNMAELPTLYTNRIMETEFTFTVINPGTPEDVKRNIFKRINTGGMMLSPQEIRNALYGGECSWLLNELADMRCFKDATGWSVKSLRMEDKELVLRFVAFLIRDYRRYNKSVNVDTWLGDTMMIYNAMPGLDNRDIKKLVKEEWWTDTTITTDSEGYAVVDAFKGDYTIGEQQFADTDWPKYLIRCRKSTHEIFETRGILESHLQPSGNHTFADTRKTKQEDGLPTQCCQQGKRYCFVTLKCPFPH